MDLIKRIIHVFKSNEISVSQRTKELINKDNVLYRMSEIIDIDHKSEEISNNFKVIKVIRDKVMKIIYVRIFKRNNRYSKGDEEDDIK